MTVVKKMTGHSCPVRALAVDWNLMKAVSGAEDNARVWDLNLGGCLCTLPGVEDGCAVIVADWSATAYYAVGGCGDGLLRRWDMHFGKELNSFHAHDCGVWALHADWLEKFIASARSFSSRFSDHVRIVFLVSPWF